MPSSIVIALMPDVSPSPIAYASLADPSGPKRQLSLFDSVCIIVGVIIGAGIFQTTGSVADAAGGRGASALFWLAGGIVSLLGALCYAELTTAYPKEGGEYVFLSRAFGPRAGFLFAWTGFWIVRPGNIGAMAYVFAAWVSAARLLPIWANKEIAWASAAVVILTALNLAGIKAGRWTQNALTLAKVLGVVIVIGLAFSMNAPPSSSGIAAMLPSSPVDYRKALILVLFTYGGWNEIGYVAAEVRDPRRQFFRALAGGVLVVTSIYLLFNEAQWWIGASASGSHSLGEWKYSFVLGTGKIGLQFLTALICLSSLGAMQGMIFAGSRIYYAVGADHPAYRWLGRWDGHGGGAPLRSLLAQGAVTLGLVVAFGLRSDSFDAMVVFTTPIFYLFFLLAAASLFVLRKSDRNVDRPFKVPLYPLTPILFAASCAFMLWSSLTYAWDNRRWEALWSIGLLVAGVVASFFTTTRNAPAPAGD